MCETIKQLLKLLINYLIFYIHTKYNLILIKDTYNMKKNQSIEEMVAEAQMRMFGNIATPQNKATTGLESIINNQQAPKNESQQVARNYNSGFDIITTLTDNSIKLYTQANDDILSYLLTQVPAAFKGGTTLADLSTEIKNINGLYQERDSVFSSINALRNDISAKGVAIRSCTQLAKANQLALEMQTQYDQEVLDIKLRITQAAESIAKKIKIFIMYVIADIITFSNL